METKEEEEPEIINITFEEISLCFPKNSEAIRTIRELLCVVENGLHRVRCTCTKPEVVIPDIQLVIEPPGSPKIEPEIQSQGEQVERPDERKDGSISSEHIDKLRDASMNVFPTIPKFKYDKKAEKNFGTLFFFETEDGRVALSKQEYRIYTTKADIMKIPYPIPRTYVPLMGIHRTKVTAIRQYREYLEKCKEDHVCFTPDTANELLATLDRHSGMEKREELRKKAEVNKARWKSKPEKEMSARTHELHDIVAKMKLPSVG